jgi:dolichol-phosphate mannosyltransferase
VSPILILKTEASMTLLADIIVPVYNERDNLPELLARLRALPDFAAYRLIFVDNASTDGSVEFIQDIPGVTLIRHPRNLGYGASLRSGITAAQTGKMVIIDADCEYPPECIPHLLQALAQNNVVYASRLLGKRCAKQAGMPLLKWWGNRMISAAYNIFFSQNITDLYTGCKAFRSECLGGIDLQRNGFEQVLELATKLAVRGYSINEIPVNYSLRSHGKSKMSHFSETIKYFFWLLFYRLQLLSVFSPRSQGVPRDGKH